MFDNQSMFKAEISFCDSFTNRKDKAYGKIYFNPLNPLSHDSNHAHIMRNILQPEAAIMDITQFYQNHGLTPRIYPSFIPNELDILGPYLESAGFVIQEYNEKTFLFPFDNRPTIDQTVSVKRISRITDDIIDLIHSEDEGDWRIGVLKKHVDDEHFHLLGLHEAGKCVSIASVKLLEGYSRVDDVLTHKNYRGQHLGTRLMRYMVGYHNSISNNRLYLWATDPIAIRMYLNVGFMEIQTGMRHWTATLK